MNSLSILICLLLASSSLILADSDWHQFKLKHGKKYENPLEDTMRKAIFIRKKREIEQFNKEQSSEAGFELGLNHLADLTKDEINNKMGTMKKPKELYFHYKNTAEAELFLDEVLGNRSEPLLESIDWREVPGRVSPVMEQGECGCCWAISAVGALEGQQLKVTGAKELINLSVQNVLDCAKEASCNGGEPDIAFTLIKNLGGIVSAGSYPYTARKSRECKFNRTDAIMTDTGYARLPIGDEHLLKEVVAKFGPVSVSIHTPATFQSYERGIYRSADCDPFENAHAVLLVGYGTEDGQDFWIIKNSWGIKWGDNGYIRIARNENNMCGVATEPVIPMF